MLADDSVAPCFASSANQRRSIFSIFSFFQLAFHTAPLAKYMKAYAQCAIAEPKFPSRLVEDGAFGSAELHLLCSRIFSAIGFRLKRRKNENREKEKILFVCIKGSNLFLKCGEIS